MEALWGGNDAVFGDWQHLDGLPAGSEEFDFAAFNFETDYMLPGGLDL
jgi:hypothetical protein